jgi:hypothetical protein
MTDFTTKHEEFLNSFSEIHALTLCVRCAERRALV